MYTLLAGVGYVETYNWIPILLVLWKFPVLFLSLTVCYYLFRFVLLVFNESHQCVDPFKWIFLAVCLVSDFSRNWILFEWKCFEYHHRSPREFWQCSGMELIFVQMNEFIFESWSHKIHNWPSRINSELLVFFSDECLCLCLPLKLSWNADNFVKLF